MSSSTQLPYHSYTVGHIDSYTHYCPPSRGLACRTNRLIELLHLHCSESSSLYQPPASLVRALELLDHGQLGRGLLMAPKPDL
jgi:hypothetical protein